MTKRVQQNDANGIYFLQEEYQDFDLDVFRGHIYQMLHTHKWKAQWVDGKKEYAIVPEPTYGNNYNNDKDRITTNN